MNLEQAVEQGIPVVNGYPSENGRTLRVWCDYCWQWHGHGRCNWEPGCRRGSRCRCTNPSTGGLKTPDCLGTVYRYFLRETDEPPTLFAFRAPTGKWKAQCDRCHRGHYHEALIWYPGCNLYKGTGYQVVARPGPGSPIFCQVTGRFTNPMTGEHVDPGYGPDLMIKYRYIADGEA